jgi:hypothetical protein
VDDSCADASRTSVRRTELGEPPWSGSPVQTTRVPGRRALLRYCTAPGHLSAPACVLPRCGRQVNAERPATRRQRGARLVCSAALAALELVGGHLQVVGQLPQRGRRLRADREVAGPGHHRRHSGHGAAVVVGVVDPDVDHSSPRFRCGGSPPRRAAAAVRHGEPYAARASGSHGRAWLCRHLGHLPGQIRLVIKGSARCSQRRPGQARSLLISVGT